jgi:hypothetical protein
MKHIHQYPDPDRCRVKRTHDDIYECETDDDSCPYILHFGYGRYCRHPDRRRVLEGMHAGGASGRKES